MVDHEDREARLIEVLVECLDWIRQSDIYDDQRDPSTQWIVNSEVRAQPALPGDRYDDPAALQALIAEAYELVDRIEHTITATEIEAGRARYRTRRRMTGRTGRSGRPAVP